MSLTVNELREKYLRFFEARGHKRIPAAPLVPVDDPTTLFTSSGMQQLVPYLKGEPHPMGKRLVDAQPSVRAHGSQDDILEVGDNRHLTFFEMLGNWSLGDYFKKEQLTWFFQFLTEELKLPPERLYATVFAGYGVVGEDEESIKIWQEIFGTKEAAREGEAGFDPKVKIYTYGVDDNWWSRAGGPEAMPVGEIGGPTSEVFFDFGSDLKLHEKSRFAEQVCHLNCNCGRFLEIGNSVFMEHVKGKKGEISRLPAQNVDFGGGLERMVAVLNGDPDLFTTSLFWPIVEELEKGLGEKYEGERRVGMRVVADHLKAASFMAAEGLVPGNKQQGYVMRRLIRRAVVKMRQLGVSDFAQLAEKVVGQVVGIYEGVYLEKSQTGEINETIGEEIGRFGKTLERGMKILEKQEKVDERGAFDLYQSYGFPFEITQELVEQKGGRLERGKFEEEVKRHQELSRTASVGMFKGGLADNEEETVRLHTATHLLHRALREVLGEEVEQRGSQITAERLRFDFSHAGALSKEEVEKVEKLVNEKIKEDLPVVRTVEDKEKALASGASAFFGEKYPEKVTVYTIGKSGGKWWSRELCGGPHVKRTGELGKFKVMRETAVGAGVRRIYAKVG